MSYNGLTTNKPCRINALGCPVSQRHLRGAEDERDNVRRQFPGSTHPTVPLVQVLRIWPTFVESDTARALSDAAPVGYFTLDHAG